jgi:hypothetical protein
MGLAQNQPTYPDSIKGGHVDYKPSYSLAKLLSQLAAYGDSGPPRLSEA